MVTPEVARKAQSLGRVRPLALVDAVPILLLLVVIVLSCYLFLTPFP